MAPDERERHGQHDDGGFDGRARVEIDDQDDDQQRERHDNHQPLLGAQHVFVLAAPENVVAAGQLDRAFGDGLVDGAHRHLDVGADVDAFHVHVNPGVGHGAFALDAHRGVDGFDFRQLAERHLRAGRRRHDDFAQRFEVLAEIAAVAQVHRVTLQAFDRRGQRHAAQRDFEHVLHVADASGRSGQWRRGRCGTRCSCRPWCARQTR